MIELNKMIDDSWYDGILLQSLHLLQRITYGHKLVLQETYVQDLLEFIIPHM